MWARFEASALFEFLRRVDGELSAPAEIVLVGGSAIATIDPTHTTSDVDLLSPGSRVFDDAVTRLRARGELVLPARLATGAVLPEPQPFRRRACR